MLGFRDKQVASDRVLRHAHVSLSALDRAVGKRLVDRLFVSSPWRTASASKPSTQGDLGLWKGTLPDIGKMKSSEFFISVVL